jgi:hypothetical protein
MRYPPLLPAAFFHDLAPSPDNKLVNRKVNDKDVMISELHFVKFQLD